MTCGDQGEKFDRDFNTGRYKAILLKGIDSSSQFYSLLLG